MRNQHNAMNTMNLLYRVLWARHIRWGLVAVTALSMQGCGGCGCGASSLPVERVNPEWISYENEDAPAPVAPKKKKRTAEPVASTPVFKLPETPQRPPQFNDWTVDDFLTAHEDRDPSLPQAAAFLGKSAATNEESLWLLTQMLELPPIDRNSIPATARNAEDGPSPAASSSGKVAAVILPAFAVNSSPLARDTLEQVLRGKIQVDMTDAQAVETILKALLLQQPASQFEDLMYQILSAPEKWRAADDERLTPDALQLACFKVVQPVATPAFRARMAQHLVHADTPPAHRERFGDWLASAAPDNLPAQIVLHNSDLLSPAAKARFRDLFARQNSVALDQLLGTTAAGIAAPTAITPGTTSPGGLFVATARQPVIAGEKPKPLDPALEATRLLWTPPFIDAIAADLGQVRDLGVERELMLLACNLPFANVRSSLHQVLLRHWDQGVAPFEKAKLTFESIRDPGFLLLAKSMPREEAKPPRPGAPPQKPTPEQAAKQAWMGASEKFLRTLNTRFNAAARMKPLPKPAAPSSSKEPVERGAGNDEAAPQLIAGLPFPLHKGAIVVGEYHLRWPAEVQDRFPDAPLSPLVLHYVRVEGEERFSKVADWYKRQLKSSFTRNVLRGQWLDGLQRDTQQHALRSVDVLISRVTDQPLVATSPPESLTVEILWIEIPDPT